MKDLIVKSFDFSIRMIEIANYLMEEQKKFPLMNRMLECGTGIGFNLYTSTEFTKNLHERYEQAYKLSLETEYLLELLVKTGYINDLQGRPILMDCRYIKDEIGKLLGKKV